MVGIYRTVSRKMGQRIFELHMLPEAEGKTGMEFIGAVFDRFVTSSWGRYKVTQTSDKTYMVVSRYFWLREALKGINKKPICAMMEGILTSLFTGKSQETPQLAMGRNGKRGFGGGSPHYDFFLGISPGHIAWTSSRNKMKSFRFEAPGRFTQAFDCNIIKEPKHFQWE